MFVVLVYVSDNPEILFYFFSCHILCLHAPLCETGSALEAVRWLLFSRSFFVLPPPHSLFQHSFGMLFYLPHSCCRAPVELLKSGFNPSLYKTPALGLQDWLNEGVEPF